MGHFADQHEVRIHPGAAVLQPCRHPMGASYISCPNGGRQAVVRIVGPFQRLRFIGEFGHRHHRPEHFAADNLVVLLRVSQHRRFKEETISVHSLAARDQANVRLGNGTFDERCDTITMLCSNQRPQFGRRIILKAVLDAPDCRAELLDEFVVNALLGVDPARGGAVLPGVVKTKGANAFNRRIDISIVEDDHRRLAAQFHVHAFDAVGGAGNDVRTGRDGPGQRDHAHFWMCDQRTADRRATAKHQIEYARREDFRRQFGQTQRGQRGLFRRLEHHGITGCESGGDFPGDHHQRVVPRRDGGDHTDRVAADHRGVAGQVFAAGRTAHATAGAGEETEHVGNCRDLVV